MVNASIPSARPPSARPPAARPPGDALDNGPALVSDLPDMPRVHLWQGRSRRRYLAAVYDIDSVELPDDSVLLLVVTGQAGGREIRAALAVGTVDATAEQRLRTAVHAVGATEVHVHLLARSAAERAAAVRDLAPLRGGRAGSEAVAA
jgi:hypothetical protein